MAMQTEAKHSNELPRVPEYAELVEILRGTGLSISHQRVSILEYLYSHRNHPTADMIYRGLKEQNIPTLSRATVYNNIRAFVAAGLVNELKLGDNDRRYDIDTHDHCHFYCQKCKKIFNLDLPSELIAPLESYIEEGHPQLRIENWDLSFFGSCPDCAEPHQKLGNKTQIK